MRTLALAVLAVLVAAVSFAGTALAASGTVALAQIADVAPPDASWLDLVKPVLAALQSGNPALTAALALVLSTTLVRKYGAGRTGKLWQAVNSDAGGTALTFLTSAGAASAAALSTGALPTLALLWASITFAAGAAGGYTAVRRLAVPALRWLEAKLPAKFRPFLSPLFNVVLWAFESRKPSAATVAKAEAAGAAAVEAKPAQGAAAVVKVGKSFP